jgi:hypothetical protein
MNQQIIFVENSSADVKSSQKIHPQDKWEKSNVLK